MQCSAALRNFSLLPVAPDGSCMPTAYVLNKRLNQTDVYLMSTCRRGQACDPRIHLGRDGRRPYRECCFSATAHGYSPKWPAATVTSSPCVYRRTPTILSCSTGP